MIKLNPLYKWTGGKRKEIKIFSNYYPNFVKENKNYTYIEPFFGGGAVYWSLNANKNIINDIDYDLINFLNQIKSNNDIIINMINDMSIKIHDITAKEKANLISKADAKSSRGFLYYEWRNKDRNYNLKTLSNIDRAFRFLFVNQLSFNGMRRFNSKGEFNVPYGNYKTFNIDITKNHIELLKKTDILCNSYKDIIVNNDNENTFIFLDPPYTREFNEYSHNNIFLEKQQIELANIFKQTKKANIMLIINKDDFTTNLYKDFIKYEYNVKYSTNIKNRYDNSTKHLIITNY
jgi:DNA adenine methylase